MRLKQMVLLTAFVVPVLGQAADEAALKLTLRKQAPIKAGAVQFHTLTANETWDPRETAIIICDVWDRHHCLNAVRRVEEFGPRLNEVVKNLRGRGVTVIHAPSDCMEAYNDHPARLRVSEVPVNGPLPDDIKSWCNRIPSEEQAVYPIDQSDGGEDDDPKEHAEWAAKLAAEGRNPKLPWKAQSDLIQIDGSQDFISDKGDEIWGLLQSRGIKNVILAGVHTNMCVLGRPFGLRQMARNGKHVVLLRDMTDTMYNPKMWPYVSHFEGTDRIIAHVERHVCPTITSDQILGGEPFRFSGDTRPHVVIVTSEYEYKTEITLPEFAGKHLGKDFRVSYVYGLEEDGNELTNLEALKTADVMLVSVRRRALRTEQLDLVRQFIAAGKPAIGIRTASHAFALRDEKPGEGRSLWPEFDAQVWGGSYHGHYGEDLATTVTPVEKEPSHPIMTGIGTEAFPSTGTLYETAPLHEGTSPLAMGKVEGKPEEPCAWTFKRADGGKSFYTSLGHRGDFENPKFVRMLKNAVYWAAGKEPPQEFEVTTALEELKRHWTSVRVPGSLDEAFAGVLKNYEGPVWFRCGVRIPSRITQSPFVAPWWHIRGDSPQVWINGQSAFQCRTAAGESAPLFDVRKEYLERDDANLLVVRFGRLSDVGDFMTGYSVMKGPSVRFGPGPDVEPVEFRGSWEIRLGDDPSWSQPALPAKFALPTEVYFEE